MTRKIILVDIGHGISLYGILPSVELDAPYSATLFARGGTAPYTYTVTAGTLPAGLQLDPATGIVSGTATAAGSSTFTVRATDLTGASVQRQYGIAVTAVVAPPLTITGTYPDGTVGTAYSADLTITGGVAPYSNARVTSGALPTGLTLSIVGDKLRLSGTPCAEATASFTAAVDSSDGQTATSMQTVAIAAGVDWLAVWNLDELSGTVAVDSSGHGYDSEYIGTGYTLGNMSLLPSGAGHSYRNAGTAASAVVVPNACTAARSAAFTILAYCRLSEFANGPQIYADDKNGMGLVISSTGQLTLAKVGVAALATDTTHLALATTYMLGVTYDESTVAFYVNGVRTSSHPLSLPEPLKVTPTYLGAYRNGYPTANILRGYMQRVRVANRVLSDAEIATLYATD